MPTVTCKLKSKNISLLTQIGFELSWTELYTSVEIKTKSPSESKVKNVNK